jgi:hypothetical protein
MEPLISRVIVALGLAATRWVDIRKYDHPSTAAGDRTDEPNHQHSTIQKDCFDHAPAHGQTPRRRPHR